MRAKSKIRAAGIPYRVPPDHLLPDRLAAALAVVYLIFNEGYSATGGDALTRPDLMAEAIRLGGILAALMPDEPEVLGLEALMLLQASRTHARTGAGGELVLLEDQDRSLWDRDLISRGAALLDRAVALRRPGPYQLQAAIAALHAQAAAPEETDWRADRAPLRRARAAAAVARRRVEPRRRRRDGATGRTPGSSCSTDCRSTATTSSTLPAPTSCAARAAPWKPAPRTSVRASSRRTLRSARSSSGASPRSSMRPTLHLQFAVGVAVESPDFQAFRGAGRPRFANRAELECAKLLDYYGVPWDYEPTTFVLETDGEGRVTEAFTPDFYLPEQDLYLEITVMKQTLVTRKNRKLRKLRELYPDVNAKLFYRRDVERLAERLRLDLAVVSAGEYYLTAGQLLARARELGAAITRDYEERDLVLVVPLRGSFIFGVDLSRSLTLPHEIDFVELEPYHRGERGVRLVKDLDGDIRGRDVLVAVDVVDTGLTMHYLCKTLRLREPGVALHRDAARPAVPAPRRRPARRLHRVHRAGRALRRVRLRPRGAVPEPSGPAHPRRLSGRG